MTNVFSREDHEEAHTRRHLEDIEIAEQTLLCW